MFYKKLLIGTLAAFMSCLAFSEESKLSYSYIGLGYQATEVVGETFKGFNVSASADVSDSLYLIGAYSLVTSDNPVDASLGDDDVDLTQVYTGIGFHTPINEDLDAFTNLSYTKVDIDFLDVAESGNGYLVEAGIRGKPTDKFEFGASANYENIDDESDVSYSLSARLFFTSQVSLGAKLDKSDDIDSLSLIIRVDI